MEAEAQAVLAAAAQNVELPKHRIESHHAISDSPYEAIIDAAKNKECEVIVMASHGRRGVAGVVLGSETQKVLTHSRVPVLVVR